MKIFTAPQHTRSILPPFHPTKSSLRCVGGIFLQIEPKEGPVRLTFLPDERVLCIFCLSQLFNQPDSKLTVKIILDLRKEQIAFFSI